MPPEGGRNHGPSILCPEMHGADYEKRFTSYLEVAVFWNGETVTTSAALRRNEGGVVPEERIPERSDGQKLLRPSVSSAAA